MVVRAALPDQLVPNMGARRMSAVSIKTLARLQVVIRPTHSRWNQCQERTEAFPPTHVRRAQKYVKVPTKYLKVSIKYVKVPIKLAFNSSLRGSVV